MRTPQPLNFSRSQIPTLRPALPKSSRMNTCKSVSKQRTLTTFRINTYEKQREEGLTSFKPKTFLSPRLAAVAARSSSLMFRRSLSSTLQRPNVSTFQRSEVIPFWNSPHPHRGENRSFLFMHLRECILQTFCFQTHAGMGGVPPPHLRQSAGAHLRVRWKATTQVKGGSHDSLRFLRRNKGLSAEGD